jgi:hypothetical protein
MIAGFNILGFIFNSRKYILALGVGAVLLGCVLVAKNYYYEWHTKPLFELSRDLKSTQKDLNSSREKLKACENSKAVEVFVTENRSVFDNYRETIKEMENEEFNVSRVNDNHDWMYR